MSKSKNCITLYFYRILQMLLSDTSDILPVYCKSMPDFLPFHGISQVSLDLLDLRHRGNYHRTLSADVLYRQIPAEIIFTIKDIWPKTERGNELTEKKFKHPRLITVMVFLDLLISSQYIYIYIYIHTHIELHFWSCEHMV